jgi:hypothetical protein
MLVVKAKRVSRGFMMTVMRSEGLRVHFTDVMTGITAAFQGDSSASALLIPVATGELWVSNSIGFLFCIAISVTFKLNS